MWCLKFWHENQLIICCMMFVSLRVIKMMMMAQIILLDAVHCSPLEVQINASGPLYEKMVFCVVKATYDPILIVAIRMKNRRC